MGHLRDLPKSKMGVDLEHDFEPDYQPLASKAAIISELRSASKAAKHIYLRPTRTARERRSRGI